MPRFTRRFSALALGLILLAGCGESEPKFGRRPIALDKVPPEVMAAAKKHFPNVEIQDAWTNHAEGKDDVHSYEIRGKVLKTNKTREVRVGLDGKILEEE